MSFRQCTATLLRVLTTPSFSHAAGAAADDRPVAPDQASQPIKAGLGQTSADKEKKSEKTQDKAFRTAQRGALAQMKSTKPAQRTEAFEKLKEFPTTECAKLLVQQGLASKYEDVRRAAYATLISFRDSRDVCSYLL